MMDSLYTVVYDCDNGKNWKRVPAAELEDLIDNLTAFGMDELYIFSPLGTIITPSAPLPRNRYLLRLFAGTQEAKSDLTECLDYLVGIGTIIHERPQPFLKEYVCIEAITMEDHFDLELSRLKAENNWTFTIDMAYMCQGAENQGPNPGPCIVFYQGLYTDQEVVE